MNLMMLHIHAQNFVRQAVEYSMQISFGNMFSSFFLHSFAFAETVSQEEVQKAVKSMESVEISGRRLRVRSAADKDKKTSSAGGASQPK